MEVRWSIQQVNSIKRSPQLLHWGRFGTWRTGWSLILLSGVLLGGDTSGQTGKTGASSVEIDQALVVVWADPAGDMISINYDRKVPPGTVQIDLKTLAKHAGWSPQGAKITHEAAPGGMDGKGGPVTTSVEFRARALDPKTRMLPLEPIVLTFKRFKRVGAAFFVPPRYPYWGPLNASQSGVSMRGQRGQGTYSFRFRIQNPEIKEFKLALIDPAKPKPSPVAPSKKSNPLPFRIAIVILSALGIAAIVYAVATMIQNRSTQAER
jgi:hypothetical protein